MDIIYNRSGFVQTMEKKDQFVSGAGTIQGEKCNWIPVPHNT